MFTVLGHTGSGEFIGLNAVQGEGSRQRPVKGLIAAVLAILDFLFGCHHAQLSRVFTVQGETYKVCCDCGAKFAYSLDTMSIKSHLPLARVPTRFRIA